MPAPYRPAPLSDCQAGGDPHPAGLVPGTEHTYLYAAHHGAHLTACATHSGLCHPACWPEPQYPGLWERAAARHLRAGQLTAQGCAQAARDGADPSRVEAIALGAGSASRAR